MRIGSGSELESSSIGGDRPVRKTMKHSGDFLSTAGHVKPRGNLGGPSSKAKYSSATDSEPVP